MSGLIELAEQCEKASHATDELNEAIARAIGFRQLGSDFDGTPCEGHWVSPNDWDARVCWEGWTSNPDAPDFTGSLDAAMALIPDGWHTHLASQDRHSLRWKWSLRGGFGFTGEGRANTAALALCTAALRAREPRP